MAPSNKPPYTPKPSLWQSLLSPRRMDKAWEKVKSNAGCSGGDNISVHAFGNGAARRLPHLIAALRKGEYCSGPYRVIDIPKKKGGKRRLLIPSVADRIVHTALAQVLTPVLDPQFEDASFAYRPGRSVKQAVQAIERWRDAGFWHVIEADIVGFFDAIMHDLLLEKLEAALRGRAGAVEVVDLVAAILQHQSQQVGIMGKGVAQGSPLSPLLANLYLDAVDEAMAGKGVRLVRVADDFVILCKRRKDADMALADAAAALADHGLELHDDKTRVWDFDRGFAFLGHLFVRSLVFQQVSDPAEDPVVLLRDIAREDAQIEAQIEQDSKQHKAGYDQGARILYMTEPGRALELRNLSFSIRGDGGRELAAISHGRVDRIEIGPGVQVGPEVLEHCLSSDTDFAFVDGYGTLRGQLVRPQTDRADLHLAQAAMALDADKAFIVARALVDARIRNQRTQIFRLNRARQYTEASAALTSMGRHLRKLKTVSQLEQLRGLEGVAAAEYWPALGVLTKHASRPLRRSRPALDPLNASINYLSAILLRDTRTAVLAAGLHPGFGALHVARDRAEAALYDLMEPFRAPLTEGLAAFLFNAKRLRPEMFSSLRGGGVRMSRDAVGAIITGYEQAVAKRVNVTGRSYKLAWRPMMRRQAQDLANALRKDRLEDFQPYLMEA